MKKIISIVLVLLCMLCVFTGCGKAETEEATWYELEKDAGVLTVRLPVTEEDGYSWDFSISDDGHADFLTSEVIDGQYVASFRGIGSGEGSISFSYECGDDVKEVRTVSILVENDKISNISDAVILELPEIG